LIVSLSHALSQHSATGTKSNFIPRPPRTKFNPHPHAYLCGFPQPPRKCGYPQPAQYSIVHYSDTLYKNEQGECV